MQKRNIEKTGVMEWLDELSKVGKNEKNAKLWDYVYKLASRPKRRRIAVNLSKLQKHAQSGDNVIVPGKVLGGGKLSKELNITAVEYSHDAEEKIKKANGKILGLQEMRKKENVRIII
jgi:large subunit ribosomal protein L18e